MVVVASRVDHAGAATPECPLDLEATVQQPVAGTKRQRCHRRQAIGDARCLAQKRVIRPLGRETTVVLTHYARHAGAYYAAAKPPVLNRGDIVMTDDEQELRRAWETGDFRAVTTMALERYGPEILGVLAVQLSSTADAAEAFSLFSEDLWSGVPGFQWRCSLRAWAHRIARHAAVRWATAGARSPERNLSMEQGGVFELAAQVRSSTLVHLRTEVKSEVRRLREELPQAEQMLLILRVDKALGWPDIAAALADHDLDADELKREAARLRKRFQLVTGKLRGLARERGILDRQR
ncbi:MAG TPA: hypothetical protein VIX73_36085 [Kofleriaceae bacterium]